MDSLTSSPSASIQQWVNNGWVLNLGGALRQVRLLTGSFQSGDDWWGLLCWRDKVSEYNNKIIDGAVKWKLLQHWQDVRSRGDDYTPLLRVQQVADNMPSVPSQLWYRHVQYLLCFSRSFRWWALTPRGSQALHPVPDASWKKPAEGSTVFQDLGRINTGKSINTNWILS